MNDFEFKGTPGPWDYEECDRGPVNIYSQEFEPGYPYFEICYFFEQDSKESKTISLRNAELIAAAPEMFELLKRCLKIDPCEFDMEIENLLSRVTTDE